MFEAAAAAFKAPGGPGAPGAVSAAPAAPTSKDDDIAALKEQLAGLQDKLNKLGS